MFQILCFATLLAATLLLLALDCSNAFVVPRNHPTIPSSTKSEFSILAAATTEGNSNDIPDDAANSTSPTTTTTPAPVLNGKRVLPLKVMMGGLKGQSNVAATYALFSADYKQSEWQACQHVGITRNLQETLQQHINENGSIAFVRALSFVIPNEGAMESIAADWRKEAIQAGGKTNLDPVLAAMELDFDQADDDDDEDDDEDDYMDMMAGAMSASRSDLASARGIVEPEPVKKEEPVSPFEAVYSTTADGGRSLEFNRENVDKVLDEIRPYLISDGGNVAVERIDEETRNVYLKLEGACGSCPSSTVTMQMGIERVLKENFANLGQVLQAEDDKETKPKELTYQAVEQEVNRIKPAIIAMGGLVDIVSVDPIGVVELKFRGANKVKTGLELALLDIDFVKHVKFVMDD
jgi:Fe-S cluster biogenesis protein NfuA